MNTTDVEELRNRGADKRLMGGVGFGNFTRYMEGRIEEMFASAIAPVQSMLQERRDQYGAELTKIAAGIEHAHPSQLESLVKDAGQSLGRGVEHVMAGVVASEKFRMTMEEELREFHKDQALRGTQHLTMLPSEDFASLDEYVAYLRDELQVPAFDVEINGGAQFKRLLREVEIFLRFSEICVATEKKDVIQAKGVSMGSVTWREVVVKILNNQAHLPMQKRVRYVAERIRWFFCKQKEVIIDFMESLKGSADEHQYSALYSKHVKLIQDNEEIRNLVFETFDNAVERQMRQFNALFDDTFGSTFSNPWVFLKGSSTTTTALDPELPAAGLPSFEDVKARIPGELEARGDIETELERWIAEIPPPTGTRMDEAVEKVQLLVIKTFSFIRAQIADQVELFAESFFKLPMMRLLEEDMAQIKLSEVDRETYEARRDSLQAEQERLRERVTLLAACDAKLEAFAQRTQTRKRLSDVEHLELNAQELLEVVPGSGRSVVSLSLSPTAARRRGCSSSALFRGLRSLARAPVERLRRSLPPRQPFPFPTTPLYR